MLTEEPKKKLPNMNEFSPSVVGELGPLLQLVCKHPGARDTLVRAIAKAAKTIPPRPNDQHLVRANNVLIGMSQCGLFDLNLNQLTPFGVELASLQDIVQLHERFARHLLNYCHGSELLDVVRALDSRGDERTGNKIREELRARGYSVTTNEGNPSKIRLWLERSGIVDSDWSIHEDRYTSLLGISLGEQDEWKGLSRSQRAFLLTLRQIASGRDPDWISGSHIKELCLAQYGRSALPEGDLRAKVIYPLEAKGWIAAQGKGEGRGGKLGEIKPSPKFLAITSELEVEHQGSGIPHDLRKKLETPLEKIYEDLNSSDKYKKGIALELLCLRLCQDLGLTPVEFRKRSAKTQGAEVDLIAEGIHLHYSRWIFQCKNTPTSAVDVEDLAKEIGLAVLLRAHVIVMVTTGRFTKIVKKYGDGVATETHLQVVLVDHAMLKQFREHGGERLIDIFRLQAREALSLKAAQVNELIGEEE